MCSIFFLLYLFFFLYKIIEKLYNYSIYKIMLNEICYCIKFSCLKCLCIDIDVIEPVNIDNSNLENSNS